MLEIESQKALYRLIECPDLMVDGCVCDDQNDLIFLSVWGRDTVTQEFLARLTLGSDGKGLDQFRIAIDNDRDFPVFVRSVDRLEKRMTRAYRGTLFGSINHLWLIDRRCIEPDKANAQSLAILPKHAPDRTQRLWGLVQKTCPLPLLDQWRDVVLDLLRSQSMLTSLPVALGAIEAFRLALDVPVLTGVLGDLIRNRTLRVTTNEPTSDVSLPRVA